MRSLGVIPARGGSKSIPDKNIAILDGLPLIAYTIQAASNSKLTNTIVSTDSDKIASVANDYNGDVIMRPEYLSTDITPTLPVLRHAYNELNEEDYDIVVTLQPTSPLRTHKHINEALELFSSDSSADSLVSVKKIPHNYSPISIMKISENGYLDNYLDQESIILRKQDKPNYFARNSAISITRPKDLKNFVFGGNIIPYLMDSISSIDIDYEEDICFAEALLAIIKQKN